MAEPEEISDILADAVQEAESNSADPKELSLDAMLLLLTTERLRSLEEQSKAALTELKKRQQRVSFLHKLIKAINTATSEKGDLDLKENGDLKNLMAEAKEFGVNIDEEKESYAHDERERLVENIRMTIEDLNVENDMQLQTVSRLTHERYEAYQLARSIHKPKDDTKTRMAQNISR